MEDGFACRRRVPVRLPQDLGRQCAHLRVGERPLRDPVAHDQEKVRVITLKMVARNWMILLPRSTGLLILGVAKPSRHHQVSVHTGHPACRLLHSPDATVDTLTLGRDVGLVVVGQPLKEVDMCLRTCVRV